MSIKNEVNELQNRLDTIQGTITNLSRECDDLRHKLLLAYKSKLTPLVGKCCYLGDYVYAKIIATPDYYWNDTLHRVYDAAKLPALLVNTDEYDRAIYQDTVFSEACYADDPVEQFNSEYREISLEEFEKQIASVIGKLESGADNA